jgi:autotransporter-associated beta strand protein
MLPTVNDLFAQMPAGSLQVGTDGMTINIPPRPYSSETHVVKTDSSAPGIQGDVGLTKTSPGTLVLTNENTYKGGTTISAGTLRIGAIGNFSFDTIYNPDNVQLGVVYKTFAEIVASGVAPDTGAGNPASMATSLDKAANIDPATGDFNSGNADFDNVLLEIAIGEDATVGGVFGFGQPELDNYGLADAEIEGDSYLLSAYGTLTGNRWELFGMLGYTWGNYDSERHIRAGDIARTAKGDFDGDRFIASAIAAYDYPVEGFDLIPEVGITYSQIWQDGFTEKGAGSLDRKVKDADA